LTGDENSVNFSIPEQLKYPKFEYGKKTSLIRMQKNQGSAIAPWHKKPHSMDWIS
jgi:hypothetical protein